MKIQHFTLTAGEDRVLSLTATSATGAVLDITSASMTWRLAKPGGDAIITKTPVVVSGPAGTYTVSLTDTDTDDLQGTYTYQTRATVSNTTTLCTQGNIKVEGLTGLPRSVVSNLVDDGGDALTDG
jgi:hypothetical protein